MGDDAAERWVKAFEREGDHAVAVLEQEERLVVGRIVADVGLLLGGEPFGSESEAPAVGAEDELFRHLRGLEESLAEPDDPAILRLLPRGAADKEVADEFRRLTEPELRAQKVARLRDLWSSLSEDADELRVPLADVLPVAAALTDVRLVVAARLGLETDDDAQRLHSEIELAHHAMETDADEELGVDPERMWLGMLYQALTWLQDSLVACVVDEEGADE